MANKDDIFKKKTVAEIKKDKEQVLTKSLDTIIELALQDDNNDKAAIICGNYIPGRFFRINPNEPNPNEPNPNEPNPNEPNPNEPNPNEPNPNEPNPNKPNPNKPNPNKPNPNKPNPNEPNPNKPNPNDPKDILTRTQAARKFMKHEHEVNLPRYGSIEKAIISLQGQGKIPKDILIERYDLFAAKGHKYLRGFSFYPIIGNDKTKHIVHLSEVCEGAKLYAYASKRAPIEVKPYSRSLRAAIDGAFVDVSVPSRSLRKGRYDITISGLTVVKNSLRFALANSIRTNHVCAYKKHLVKRYKHLSDRENSPVIYFDAHEISAIFAAEEHYLKKKGNLVPLEMSIIPIPSKKLAKIYDYLKNNVCILAKENYDQKDERLYPLNEAEIEIALNYAVLKLGARETLYCDKRRDGKLRDYNWKGLEKVEKITQ
jgi:hypothetical protein